jgi:hypothetical protein
MLRMWYTDRQIEAAGKRIREPFSFDMTSLSATNRIPVIDWRLLYSYLHQLESDKTPKELLEFAREIANGLMCLVESSMPLGRKGHNPSHLLSTPLWLDNQPAGGNTGHDDWYSVDFSQPQFTRLVTLLEQWKDSDPSSFNSLGGGFLSWLKEKRSAKTSE